MPKYLNAREEEYWEKAKDIFKKSYGKNPTSDRDWAIVQKIFQKIKQAKENYTEGFIDDMKAFFMKHVNNPIITLLIVKYITNLLGKQSYNDKIKSLKEKLNLKENNVTLYHGSKARFNKFSGDGVHTESNDQEGVGIYLTTNKNEAMRYGNIIYTVQLNSYNEVPKTGVMNKKDILYLINNAPDKEISLSDWAEKEQDAINMYLKLNSKYNNQPFEYFKQIWYDFYRYFPKEFLINMSRLGYDYATVKTVDSTHYIVYNWDKLQIINIEDVNRQSFNNIKKLKEKLNLKEKLIGDKK